MSLIEIMNAVFEKHGIRESGLQVMLLVELKATQQLIMNAVAAGNEKQFHSIAQTFSKDSASAFVDVLEKLYGPTVANEILSQSADLGRKN